MEKYYIVVIKTGYPMGVGESARDAWTHAITSMQEPFDIGTPDKIDSAISYLQGEGLQVFRVQKIEEDKNELLEKT